MNAQQRKIILEHIFNYVKQPILKPYGYKDTTIVNNILFNKHFMICNYLLKICI